MQTHGRLLLHLLVRPCGDPHRTIWVAEPSSVLPDEPPRPYHADREQAFAENRRPVKYIVVGDTVLLKALAEEASVRGVRTSAARQALLLVGGL